MKSMRICFCASAVLLILLCPVAAKAVQEPQRIPQLDSLAADISAMGLIPTGGRLPVLAASNNWFGLLSGVRFLPGDSDELTSIFTDTTGECRYYGSALWSAGGDIVLVTAPSFECRAYGMRSAVETGTQVFFRLDGYDGLDNPRTAVGTPDLEVIEIIPDSNGTFAFNTPVQGVYWVEVMCLTESGPSVELLFPVIAGGDASDVFRGAIEITDSEAASPAEVLSELNSIRFNRGIPLLQSSNILDSIAVIRAGSLAYSGSSSHYAYNGHGLEDILPNGISVFGENIGRGTGYQEAWTMILISPFHFQTCMSPEYSHAGIAGSVDSSEYEWQLVMVQVFTAGEQ